MAKSTLSIKALFAVAAPVFVGGMLTLSSHPATAQGQGPGNPLIPRLGKALFFERDLSTPGGQACVSCHSPIAGFSSPDSTQNLQTGIIEGAEAGRYGNRKPPTISYASFIPVGKPTFDPRNGTYVGGLFFDGRAPDLPTQAQAPLQNPNEMNNLVHNVGSPALIVAEVERGPNAALFEQTFGPGVFQQPTAQVFQLIVQSIAAWEHTPEVSPFSSKYDAVLQHSVTFTAAELAGMQIFTGSLTGRQGGPPAPINAQCSSCHVLAPTPGAGPDLFTDSHYRNVGVPRNPNNPYYKNVNEITNPLGYNPLGENYIDLGLADFLYPNGGDVTGDPLHIKGVFKTPTLRNVDTRPSNAFVKSYGHNGFFKNLPQLVHFYNTRNLTTVAGEVINFTKANPYLGLKGKPLWPEPEYLGNIQNPTGSRTGPGSHIGNLGLTTVQEADLVAFIRTLSDGYFNPQGPPPGP